MRRGLETGRTVYDPAQAAHQLTVVRTGKGIQKRLHGYAAGCSSLDSSAHDCLWSGSLDLESKDVTREETNRRMIEERFVVQGGKLSKLLNKSNALGEDARRNKAKLGVG